MRIRMAYVVCGLALALVPALAGCGGSGEEAADPSAESSVSEEDRALQWAQCMRDHGVDVPDPEFNGDGGIGMSIPEGTDPDAVDAANEACKELMPNGGEPQEADPEQLAKGREYAECMRENGVPEFPDPGPDGGIALDGNVVDPEDPDVKAAEEACQGIMGPGGSNETHEEGE